MLEEFWLLILISYVETWYLCRYILIFAARFINRLVIQDTSIILLSRLTWFPSSIFWIHVHFNRTHNLQFFKAMNKWASPTEASRNSRDSNHQQIIFCNFPHILRHFHTLMIIQNESEWEWKIATLLLLNTEIFERKIDENIWTIRYLTWKMFVRESQQIQSFFAMKIVLENAVSWVNNRNISYSLIIFVSIAVTNTRRIFHLFSFAWEWNFPTLTHIFVRLW